MKMKLPEHTSHAFKRLITQLSQLELTTLLILLALGGGLWAAVELTDEVLEGTTRSVDQAILLAMREPNDLSDPLGPQWFEEAVRDLTALGSISIVTFVTLAAVGFLALQGRFRAMCLVLVAVLGAVALSLSMKRTFDRSRPDLVPHGAYVHTAAYPSGHSMIATSAYLTLGAFLARIQPRRRLKVYLLALAILLSLVVGLSRIYLGVHWPTDVLGGWTLGTCWALLCWLIALQMQRRGAIRPAHPGN